MNGAVKMAVLVAGAIGFASGANAATEFKLDINQVRAQTTDSGGNPDFTFGLGVDPVTGFNILGEFTGTVALSATVFTSLASVSVGSTTVNNPAVGVGSILAEIQLDAGIVSGGFFDVVLGNGDAYSATAVPNSGRLISFNGTSGSIDGLTMSGFFPSTTGGTFAGVTLGVFDTTGLFGSFFEFSLAPSGPDFVDNDTNLQLTAVIPLPTTVGLGLAGLSLLGIRRRRTAV